MHYMNRHLNTRLKDVLNMVQRRIVTNTKYFGIKCSKSPMDFWVYREMIFEMKPDVIIELGCGRGGATLALAHTCDLINHGRVYAIDNSTEKVDIRTLSHPRVTVLEGDACALFAHIRDKVGPDESVFVIEDTDHTYENTLNILNTYSPLIKKGGYFIVEDTNGSCGIGRARGAFEATETFTKQNTCFECDRSKEVFFITWNPKGYLRRIE